MAWDENDEECDRSRYDDEPEPIECRECGKWFYGRGNECECRECGRGRAMKGQYRSYDKCWADAYARAKATGIDQGIEVWNCALVGGKYYTFRGIPKPEHSYGCDATCERVVAPKGVTQ